MPSGNFHTVRPALILLSGLPGTGKTTFAHALRALLEFEQIESDAVRRSMSARPTYSHSESGAVFAIVDSMSRKALRAGRHALVDATNLTAKDRARFVAITDELRAPLLAVRLVAPEATIRARISGPRDGFSQAGPDIYERMRGRAELFRHPVVVVDTRFELGPALRLVAALANSGGDG